MAVMAQYSGLGRPTLHPLPELPEEPLQERTGQSVSDTSSDASDCSMLLKAPVKSVRLTVVDRTVELAPRIAKTSELAALPTILRWLVGSLANILGPPHDLLIGVAQKYLRRGCGRQDVECSRSARSRAIP